MSNGGLRFPFLTRKPWDAQAIESCAICSWEGKSGDAPSGCPDCGSRSVGPPIKWDDIELGKHGTDRNAQHHYVRGDTPGYLSVVSGKWVDGARARRDDLKRTGCRPYEGREAEDKEAARHRAYAEQKSEAKLTEHAERAYAQLSPQKRRHLGGD